MKSTFWPLVKMPEKVDMALFLIREELKIRKLFSTLNEIGLSDCCYEPNLDNLILKLLDLNDGKDETFEVYCEIIDRRSRKINDDREKLMKQALKVYKELLEVKRIKERN